MADRCQFESPRTSAVRIATRSPHQGASVHPAPLLLAALIATNPALTRADGQTSSGSTAATVGPLPEVVITALKRTTTVHDTPDSMSVLGTQELLDRGVPSLAALAQGTPGVSLKTEGPSQTEVEMRGMTSSGGNSATVGFYLDDIPLTGPASAQNGHVVIDPDLYDLNRVEVLRGPQGTLFGSGSMGGTVRLITNQPNLGEFQASAQSVLSGTDGGGFNHNDNAMMNLPLIDHALALRLVATEDFTSGWIDRIVLSQFPLAGGTPLGNVRGAVQNAPIETQYPGSNAYQIYAGRASLLWKPTENLAITPALFHESSAQNGISAYDSTPGTETHYQPFNIAEPLTDWITAYSLNATYSFPSFDLTSSTARWSRVSTQVEEASEAFNNPLEGITYNSNNGLPGPGYYGLPGEAYSPSYGSGPESGVEIDPSHQFSEELRLTSKGNDRLNWVTGLYYSRFYSLWTFDGTTPNYSAFMDLGTTLPATTPQWFDAYSPTNLSEYAAFGDLNYAITGALKLDVGTRVSRYDYRFSSCISGWGSALGAATPSCTGLIPLSSNAVNPKLSLSYTFSPELMVYGDVGNGSRPGGGNAIYPTTPGTIWGTAYQAMNYQSGGRWPRTYEPDSVWSYELGEKAKLLDGRLTLDTSIYYEDWRHVQLEAYPNDWALNINGNYATIYGGDIDLSAALGAGFQLQLSAGYLDEWLNGGPHWDIQPVHTLPDVAPENGTAAIVYFRPLNDYYSLTARVETTYTGRRYSLSFPNPYEASGEYIPMAAYGLTNVRAGLLFGDHCTATLFVNNVLNKHAQLESMFTENEPQPDFTRIETNQPLTAGVDLTFRY
jgi:iron complex outermembrane recepter protein